MCSMYDFDVSIIKIADDFFEAYNRCKESKNPRSNHGGIAFSVVNIPAIVNAAFASELYLKSMLTKKFKKHNLKFLFDKLPGEIQKELEKQIKPEFDALNWEKDFMGYLVDIGNVFEFWRYIHEKDKSTVYLGNRINECLRLFEIILPKFKVVAETYNKDKSKKIFT